MYFYFTITWFCCQSKSICQVCIDLVPSSGRGEDKAGVFVVRGRVEGGGGGVTFVKDYCDGSHTGVQYEGGLAGDTVTGHYTFTYKTFLVNMNIKEKFSMTVTK